MRKKNYILIGILVLLLLIAIGLAIGIVIIGQTVEESGHFDNDGAQTYYEISIGYEASATAAQITNKYNNDASYGRDDAIREFQDEIEQSNNESMYYFLSANYAYFTYHSLGDLPGAIEILQSLEDRVPEPLRPEYYLLYGDLYNSAGMSDKATLYYNLADEVDNYD